jgi:hypothetical protein
MPSSSQRCRAICSWWKTLLSAFSQDAPKRFHAGVVKVSSHKVRIANPCYCLGDEAEGFLLSTFERIAKCLIRALEFCLVVGHVDLEGADAMRRT